MNKKRLEDLNDIKWHLHTGRMDIAAILEDEAELHGGKVPRELAVAWRHLDESLKALNFFLKNATSDEEAGVVATKDAFNNELNSGTDS
jgi:hypothetical protein